MVCKHLFINIIFFVNVAYSQTNVIDSIFIRRSIDSTIAFYNKTLGEHMLLYNGREYTGNYSRTIGHPFYGSDQPQKGMVVYDGVPYSHTAISYDLVNDEVFIKTNQNISLKLLKEKIQWFSLGDRLFMRVDQHSDEIPLAIGFYEILHQGRVTVLASRRKQLVPSFNLEDPYKFVNYDRYFIKTTNSYNEIENQRSLISLFPGNEKQIRKYLLQAGINFKKNRESAIVKVAEYFGGLKR